MNRRAFIAGLLASVAPSAITGWNPPLLIRNRVTNYVRIAGTTVITSLGARFPHTDIVFSSAKSLRWDSSSLRLPGVQ